MGVRAVEAAEVELGLAELREQLLLPAAAPLAPSLERHRCKKTKKISFFITRVDFWNLIFWTEKSINILLISRGDYQY